MNITTTTRLKKR